MLIRHIGFAARLSILVMPLVSATPRRAQRRVSAQADIGVGSGEGRGGDYDGRDLRGLRLAGSVRVAATHVGLFVEVSREYLGSFSDETLVCRLRADGQCVSSYPNLEGWSTAAGVLLRPNRAVEARLGVGPAWYTPIYNRGVGINAVVGLADVAVYPVSHVGLAFIGQYIALSRYGGNRLTIRPLTLALRVR